MAAEGERFVFVLTEDKCAKIALLYIAAGYEVFVDQVLNLDPVAGALAGMIQAVLSYLNDAFQSLPGGQLKQGWTVIKYPR